MVESTTEEVRAYPQAITDPTPVLVWVETDISHTLIVDGE